MVVPLLWGVCKLWKSPGGIPQ